MLSLRMNGRTETIVFSDGLNVDKCIELQKFCDAEGIGCAFGVGTNLTNGTSASLLLLRRHDHELERSLVAQTFGSSRSRRRTTSRVMGRR